MLAWSSPCIALPFLAITLSAFPVGHPATKAVDAKAGDFATPHHHVGFLIYVQCSRLHPLHYRTDDLTRDRTKNLDDIDERSSGNCSALAGCGGWEQNLAFGLEIDHRHAPVAVLDTLDLNYRLARDKNRLVDCIAREQQRVDLFGEQLGAIVLNLELASNHGWNLLPGQRRCDAAPDVLPVAPPSFAGSKHGQPHAGI